jgi:hypothetical protein
MTPSPSACTKPSWPTWTFAFFVLAIMLTGPTMATHRATGATEAGSVSQSLAFSSPVSRSPSRRHRRAACLPAARS